MRAAALIASALLSGATPATQAAAGAFAAGAGPIESPCPAEALRIEPGRLIQAAVERSPPGAAFCLAAGSHRGQTIAPKDGQRFYGEAGAVLDGSFALTEIRREGRFWAAPLPRPPAERRGTCVADQPACDRPEAVFLDGVPLEQVLTLSDLRAGRFLVDEDRKLVVLADDPQGRIVETSVAPYAFLSNGARNVVVSNLIVENYGNPAQRGAIFDDQDERASGWLVERNEVRFNAGLGILAGPGATLRANRVHHNGQLGVSVSLGGALIEGNEIADNNIGGFDPAWEGGGLKGAMADGTIIRGNHVHHNRGPGLWCDIECRDVVYEGNLVEFNDGAGIFHEISFDATVRKNVLRFNGLRDTGWFWGAEILIAGSQGVLVEDNRLAVADDGAGIALVDQGRTRDSGGHYRTAGNRILRNMIEFTGTNARMGGVTDVDPGSPLARGIAEGDNLFNDNLYVVPDDCAVEFTWGTRVLDLAGFQGLGQDLDSRSVASVASQ